MGSGERDRATSAGWPMGFFFPFGAAPAPSKRGDRPGRVIAVCSMKGGVGKTTTSVNLATALSQEEELEVLLIDADPQGHATGCLSALVEEGAGGLADVLPRRGVELSEAIVATKCSHLDIVPAGAELQAAETTLATRIGRETVLRGMLDVPRTRYDYVIIDCPPSLSLLAVTSLVAADAVLVPSEPTPLAICGFGDLLTSLADVRERLNPALDFLGVLLTRVDGRNTRLNREALEALEQSVGDRLFETQIGVSTDLARARLKGQPTVLDLPKSRSARQYLALASEIRRRFETLS